MEIEHCSINRIGEIISISQENSKLQFFFRNLDQIPYAIIHFWLRRNDDTIQFIRESKLWYDVLGAI